MWDRQICSNSWIFYRFSGYLRHFTFWYQLDIELHAMGNVFPWTESLFSILHAHIRWITGSDLSSSSNSETCGHCTSCSPCLQHRSQDVSPTRCYWQKSSSDPTSAPTKGISIKLSTFCIIFAAESAFHSLPGSILIWKLLVSSTSSAWILLYCRMGIISAARMSLIPPQTIPSHQTRFRTPSLRLV